MRALTVILCAVALLAAGCGGDDGPDEKAQYVAKLKPLNDRLIEVSQGISASLTGSKGKDTLGVTFDIRIAQLETVNRNIERLDTPEELRDEANDLTRRIRTVVATLKKISTGVREGKEADAATATVALAQQAQAVNRAQDRLARAGGAKIR